VRNSHQNRRGHECQEHGADRRVADVHQMR
jgi:hypothetical protein